jgi:hypothetical protein
VKHTDALAAVESMFDANGIKYELYDIHCGGSKGNRMYVNFTLPQHKFAIGKEDFFPFVQLQNSYDKFIEFGLVTGLYRVACWNGNLWGTRDMQFMSKKHVSENISLTDIAWNIDTWVNQLGVAQDQIKRLIKEKLNPKTVDKIISKVLDKKKDQKIFSDLGLLASHVNEFGMTRYALFNALTAYATHVMSDPNVCKNHDKARDVQMAITDQFLVPA